MKPVDFPEFVWIWNKRQSQETPRLHRRIARWLAERRKKGDRELLLMAFRSSGKSTLIGLFCAWLLLREPHLRILVLAADFALAKKMVRNVKRVIERHPLTKGLKPKRRDQWAADQFTVNRPGELRDPSMLAKGIAANVTGSRADVVILDDVEVPDTCDTPPKRADLRARLAEMEYVLTPNGTQIYIGTPHSYYTIYADAARPEAGEARPFLDGFHRLEIPLLDQCGRSAWPERFSAERIESMRKRSGGAKFASQMLLRPVNAASGRLDPDRMRPYDDELVYAEGNRIATLTLGGKKLMSASCWWDPAYGAPGEGDSSVVAAVFTAEDGSYYLHRLRYLMHDPARLSQEDEASQLCRQVADFLREMMLPAVRIETNGLGRFLPGLLRREIRRGSGRAAVIETASRRNKDMRIIDAFDAVLAAGALHAHRSVWDTPFVSEMREWRPGLTRARDDGLDAVSGCLLSEPVRLAQALTEATPASPDWRPGAAVNIASDFQP